MNEANKTAMARFFDAIFTDEALAAQVAELAGRAGYSFSAEDLLELGKARPLSDSETAGAAGGFEPCDNEPPVVTRTADLRERKANPFLDRRTW